MLTITKAGLYHCPVRVRFAVWYASNRGCDKWGVLVVAPSMCGRTRPDVHVHAACHSYEFSGPSACLLACLPPHPSVRFREVPIHHHTFAQRNDMGCCH